MGYFDAAIQEKQDHLEHHGVLGQKWGVRRFQNRDGSLTVSGKARVVNKTNKNHVFKDNSASVSTRGSMVKAMLASYGMTAATTAMNAATLSAGFISIKGLLLNVGSVGLSAITTATLISGDVQASKANKKEKQFAEERAQNPIDKKTGFHKKTKEMTPDEDMERVNPAYMNWDKNTKNNCVLCTMTMELRRRGYDVQANKANEGYDGNELVKDWFSGAKPKETKGSMSDQEMLDSFINRDAPMSIKYPQRHKEMIDNTISEITKQPDGARGQVAVYWDGSISGHSVSYANEGGKPVIYDTQSNEKFVGNDAVRDYLSKTQSITVTRLDNCDINSKYIKEVAT